MGINYYRKQTEKRKCDCRPCADRADRADHADCADFVLLFNYFFTNAILISQTLSHGTEYFRFYLISVCSLSRRISGV